MTTPVVALDAMGGDFAPLHEVLAAVEAVNRWPVRVLLVGRGEKLEPLLKKYGSPSLPIEIVHAEETVGMDESPLTALRRKKKSSIVVAARLLKEGICHAFVSAGNTGAVMAGMKLYVGTLEGVDRPALAAVLPTRRGYTVMVDAGANIHVRPHHLLQFAVMGSVYAESILGISHPRVGTLSIGEEDSKGGAVIHNVHMLMKTIPSLNFVGNVEGKDFFTGYVDVVVCDGFVGNILLKASESLAEMIGALLKEEITKRPLAFLGYLLMNFAMKAFKRRVDYSEYGGAPLLGIKGIAIICHGRSSPKAIRNAIRVGVDFTQSRLDEVIASRIAEFNTPHYEEKSNHA